MQNNDGSQKVSGDGLKNVYRSFISDHPIVSIEDPFDQDDWEHYAELTGKIGRHVQIVGDDLLVTNPKVMTSLLWNKYLISCLARSNIKYYGCCSVWRRLLRRRLVMLFY